MKIHCALVFYGLVLTSCAPQPDPVTRARIDELEKKVEALSNLSSSVAWDVANLKKTVFGVRVAVLDPSEKGYSYASTDTGMFLFQLDSVEPFLNGYKIRLQVGNLMSATYSGFTLHVLYGRRPPMMPTFAPGDSNAPSAQQKWWQESQAWTKELRTNTVRFTDTLYPGAWNKIDFSLPNSKPEDVSYLQVIISPDRIFLRNH